MTHRPSHRSLTPSQLPRVRPAYLPRLLWAGLAAPLLLGLSACTDLTQALTRAQSKPAPEAQAAEPPAAEPQPIPEPQEKPKPGTLYEWNGDGRSITRIVVNTDEQKARFYVGDEQIGWTTVASGVSKYPTPVGHFEVMEKVENKRSNLYGKIYSQGGKVLHANAKTGRDPVPSGARFEGAKMPYFLRLTYDGIGLHAGPIPRPGRPASHGCIRMPSKMAPILFEHVNLGTKVSIVGKGPDYGNYVQKQRALAAREAARAREQREIEARRAAAAPAVAATSGDTASTDQASPPAPAIRADSPAPVAAAGAPTAVPSVQSAVADSAAETRVSTLQGYPPVDSSAGPAAAVAMPAPDGVASQEQGAAPMPAAPVQAAAPVAPVMAPAPSTAPAVVDPPQAPADQMPAPAPVVRPAAAPVTTAPGAASAPSPKESAARQGGGPAGEPRDG